MAYRADGTVIKALHRAITGCRLSPLTVSRIVWSILTALSWFMSKALTTLMSRRLPLPSWAKPTGKADERYEFSSIDIAALDQDMFDYWADLDVVTGSRKHERR
ncbi:MAG: hypothetical protein ACLT4Y_06540 [Bifidobacterium breve]